jgi:FdhD protein
MTVLVPDVRSHETFEVTYGLPSHQTLKKEIEIIAEALVGLYVNGAEMVTFACTPTMQKELAVGFLLNEGIIESMGEVGAAHLCASGLCVDIWLHHAARAPTRRILTSGCAGGVTFDDLARTMPPLESNVTLPMERLWACLKTLQEAGPLYRRSGGVHASGLFKEGQLVSIAEDIGRHNTLDKIRGDCALRGIETRDGILATTGRVSSEMLNKAARMGCPIVISRTSATSLSVQMARAWNITLVGYVRGNRATVYSGEERVAPSKLENAGRH